MTANDLVGRIEALVPMLADNARQAETERKPVDAV